MTGFGFTSLRQLAMIALLPALMMMIVGCPPVVIDPPPGQTVDTDGDGVEDDNDDCPNTPADVTVDNVGCPVSTEDVVLDIAIEPAGSGTVSQTSHGAIVTLTATPSTGWLFDTWLGTIETSQNPLTILADSATSITARFSQPPPPDADGDGVPDTEDKCAEFDDSEDRDEDGLPDDCDGCPDDANKTAPGICGCGVLDTDCDGCENAADCDDGDLCNGSETCNTTTKNCVSGTTLVCDDGVYCNGVESCNAITGCQSGTAVDCNDDDECTEDRCDENLNTCVHDIDDLDSDGIADTCDNCPSTPNADQLDDDDDGIGNDCDNCIDVANADQNDQDDDTIGDVCDNCPDTANEDQVNDDDDDFGNACDNCDLVSNPTQADLDLDDFGDACDQCPTDSNKVEPGECGCGEVEGTCQECFFDVDCDDGVDCTDDTCNTPTNECVYTPVDSNCDNGLYCDGVETCDAILGCQSGTAVECVDSDDCTIDTCDEDVDACSFVDDPTDTDNDGTIDCFDGCPNDPGSTEPGVCGCGNSDADGDGYCADVDACPDTPEGILVDQNGCPTGPLNWESSRLLSSFQIAPDIYHFSEDHVLTTAIVQWDLAELSNNFSGNVISTTNEIPIGVETTVFELDNIFGLGAEAIANRNVTIDVFSYTIVGNVATWTFDYTIVDYQNHSFLPEPDIFTTNYMGTMTGEISESQALITFTELNAQQTDCNPNCGDPFQLPSGAWGTVTWTLVP